MKLRVALFLLCGAVLFAGRADAQVSVQVVPDNGSHPHPTARLANTSGHTVTFTVINNGTVDTRYSISCTRTGSVSSVSCSPTSPLIAEGDSRVITATFAVGSAGTGRITLTATATQPTGASAGDKAAATARWIAGGWQRMGQHFAARFAASPQSTRVIEFAERQLQKKFGHAPDFGVTGNWNPQKMLEYKAAIEGHIASSGTRAIEGTYRGIQQVIHYFNPETGLNVMTTRAGEYISGWRLGVEQIANLMRNRNIQ